MHSNPVLVERRGRVALVTINRPEARNAVNRDVWLGVGRALASVGMDPDLWAVVLTGAGEVAFCAGADLKAGACGEDIRPDGPEERAWGFAGVASHHIGKPTIAAVNGFALGGGTEIALACDLVVASDTATFGLPEVKRGIIAGAGGAFRLPTQIPRKIAMEMILTGEPIGAQRALELGLINRVVAPERLLDEAFTLADAICANAPLAVQASRRIANRISDGAVPSEAEDWARNAIEGEALMRSGDALEGRRAFAEKRAPVWAGR
jgi:crotonobetainyl-CoA hydratase